MGEKKAQAREQLRGTDPTPLTTSASPDVAVPTRPNLRRTSPNLFLALIIFAVINLALGLNFLLTTPTFEQYGIPKDLIGGTFMMVGLGQLFHLFIWRNLKIVRAQTLLSIVTMVFWGVGTTQTFFEGSSSLQLFVLYFGLAALQVPLLLEPYFNPLTSNGHGISGNGEGAD